jgi:hypothetical protein
LRNAFTLSKRWLAMPPVELKSLILDIVERVTIAVNRIDIWLNRAKIAAALEAGGGSQRPDIDPITLSIEAKLRRAGKRKRLVIENGAVAEVNEGLVELIKEAFVIRNQFLSGSDASIEAMSGRLGTNKCRLTSLIRLSHLAPEIVGALLAGRHPIELTPPRLLRLSKNLPHDWKNSAVSSASPPKPPSKSSRNAPHPTTRKRPCETLRPFAPRTQTSGVSGYRRCLRRVASATWRRWFAAGRSRRFISRSGTIRSSAALAGSRNSSRSPVVEWRRD